MFSSAQLLAQGKAGIEQYNYIGAPGESAFVPVVHFETKRGWYTEARYNDDEQNTFSLYSGKRFSREGNTSWSVTPMLGVCLGYLKGSSAGVYFDLEVNNFYFSAETQYTVAFDKVNENYFYNWSETGFSISDHFYTGLTFQFTKYPKENTIDPGIVAGLSFKNISFPVYVFNPFNNGGRYFVLGLNYEYSLKKKKKPALYAAEIISR